MGEEEKLDEQSGNKLKLKDLLCLTCKHWGNNRDYAEDKGERLKSCDNPKHIYGYHIDSEDVPEDGAWLEDDEGWGMLTGPNFGCVNWE